jgi:hypothetical protein
LIYIREIRQKEQSAEQTADLQVCDGNLFIHRSHLGFAFLEEFLWETLVWNEHFSLDFTVSEIFFSFWFLYWWFRSLLIIFWMVLSGENRKKLTNFARI